jgi:hypothetical protein
MNIVNLQNKTQYFYILDALTNTMVALEFDIDALLYPFSDASVCLEDISIPYSLYEDLNTAFHQHVLINDELSVGNLSFVAACYCKLTTVYKSFLKNYPDSPSFSMFILLNLCHNSNILESIHLINRPIHGFIVDDIFNDTAAFSK